MTAVVVGADDGDLRERARRARREDGLGSRTQSSMIPRPAGSSAPSIRPPSSSWRCARPGVSRVMCQHLVHEDLEAVALLGEELAPRVA